MGVHDSPVAHALALGHGSATLVLEEDRGLLQAVSAERAPLAREASMAGVLGLGVGSWDARRDADVARGGFGLLILDGVLIRRVGLERRIGAELLTKGDLLRPWQHDGEESVMPFEWAWRVVSRTRTAILDPRWAARMAAFPEVGAELAGRALDRSRRLAVMIVIAQQPRLEHRLWLLFWALADRFGKVHGDGVHIDLPLTHELISQLVAARRPSVSAALGRLAKQGIVRRRNHAWLLSGEPPQSPMPQDGGAMSATAAPWGDA